MNTLTKNVIRLTAIFLASICFIIMIVGLSSCKKEVGPPSLCDASDPFSTLPWLEEKRVAFELALSVSIAEITSYNYEGQRLFKIDNCVACADYPVEFYDCSGAVYCSFEGFAGQLDCPQELWGNLTDEELLYTNL